MKEHNFKRSKEEQEKYEAMFMEWMEKRSKVASVRKANLEEDKRGIDFFVTNDDDTSYTIQLKVDFIADTSGNLPFETISQAYWYKRKSVIGAEFNMAQVDFIFFLLVPSMKILGYKFTHFLKFAIEHYSEFKTFAAKNYNDNGEYIYSTLGSLIPVKQMNYLLMVDEIIGG